nr:hypothetical protein [uncultured Butyrivibrio sp.]
MKFENLSNLNGIYDSFIAQERNYCFEDTEQALDEFGTFLATFKNLKADEAKKIYEQALYIGSTFEQQGFLHGLSKGINMISEVELLRERK